MHLPRFLSLSDWRLITALAVVSEHIRALTPCLAQDLEMQQKKLRTQRVRSFSNARQRSHTHFLGHRVEQPRKCNYSVMTNESTEMLLPPATVFLSPVQEISIV